MREQPKRVYEPACLPWDADAQVETCKSLAKFQKYDQIVASIARTGVPIAQRARSVAPETSSESQPVEVRLYQSSFTSCLRSSSPSYCLLHIVIQFAAQRCLCCRVPRLDSSSGHVVLCEKCPSNGCAVCRWETCLQPVPAPKVAPPQIAVI